jgi:hypothetical protein
MSDAERATLTDRDRYWLEHIQACETSGKRMIAYAAEHGLGVRAMYEGKRQLVKKGVLPRTRTSRFQRARVVDPVVSSEWRIQLPNGILVAFSGTVDAGSLATVLNTVAALG